MAAEFVEVLDISATTASVTGAETSVYSYTVSGGTLGDINSLLLVAQGRLSLADGSVEIIIRLKFGTLVATVTLQIVVDAIVDGALIIEGILSADGSDNIQVMHLTCTVGTTVTNLSGIPVAVGSGSEDSSSDKLLNLTAQVTGTGEVEFQHAVLKLIAFVEDATVPDTSTIPLTQILTLSRLNLLPHSLFRDVRFYGEFLHHLDIMGFGSAVVARAASSAATWRDGSSHTIAANSPRFEYSAGVALGLKINNADSSETLTIAGNSLHDGNTLFWRQNNVTFHAPSTTNPFNSSGLWTGTNNIHISFILKFSRVLTAVELAVVASILDGPDPT